MIDVNFVMKIEYIIDKLREKGYTPLKQLACYVLLEGNQYYITNHGNARSMIKELDIRNIREYLERKGIDWGEFLKNDK